MVAALKSLGPSSMFSLPHCCWCLKSELEREGWKGEDDRIKWNVLYSTNWENVVILFLLFFLFFKVKKNKKKIGELLRFMSYLWSRIFNAFFYSLQLPIAGQEWEILQMCSCRFSNCPTGVSSPQFSLFSRFSPNTLCSSSLYNRLSAQLCSGERWLVEEINFTENFLLRSSAAASSFFMFSGQTRRFLFATTTTLLLLLFDSATHSLILRPQHTWKTIHEQCVYILNPIFWRTWKPHSKIFGVENSLTHSQLGLSLSHTFSSDDRL